MKPVRLLLVVLGLLGLAVVGYSFIPKATPLDRAEEMFARGEYVSAFKIYKVEADKGDPLAQFAMGRILEQGLGPELYDPALAFEYMTRSAVGGYGYAMMWLSNFYNSDNLSIRDEEASLLWLGSAVDSNVPGAWGKLMGAEILYTNMEIVTSWAEQDMPFALNVMFYFSSPLGADVACSWVGKIEAKQTAVSLHTMATTLKRDTCGNGDDTQSLTLLTRSAEMGFVPAILDMADHYSNISLDDTLYWTFVAARMGEEAPKDIKEMIQIRSVGVAPNALKDLRAKAKSFKAQGQPRRLQVAQNMR